MRSGNSNRGMLQHVGASACKGMSLRTGAGKCEQVWAHGATQSFGVEVQEVLRAGGYPDTPGGGVGTEGRPTMDGLSHLRGVSASSMVKGEMGEP